MKASGRPVGQIAPCDLQKGIFFLAFFFGREVGLILISSELATFEFMILLWRI